MRVYFFLTLILFFSASSCLDNLLESSEFAKDSMLRFADQDFKKGIALIELHKIRSGEYPKTLSEINFIGDWDKSIIHALDYERQDSGYILNVIPTKLIKIDSLNYPPEFYQGLGLIESNVRKD